MYKWGTKIMTNMNTTVSVMVLETDGRLKLGNWGELNKIFSKLQAGLREQ